MNPDIMNTYLIIWTFQPEIDVKYLDTLKKRFEAEAFVLQSKT